MINPNDILNNTNFASAFYYAIDKMCKDYFNKYINQGDYYGYKLVDNGVKIQYVYHEYYYNTDILDVDAEVFVPFEDLFKLYE